MVRFSVHDTLRMRLQVYISKNINSFPISHSSCHISVLMIVIWLFWICHGFSTAVLSILVFLFPFRNCQLKFVDSSTQTRLPPWFHLSVVGLVVFLVVDLLPSFWFWMYLFKGSFLCWFIWHSKASLWLLCHSNYDWNITKVVLIEFNSI